VLVGPERLVLDGVGTWAHRWGSTSAGPWSRYRVAGRSSRGASVGDRPVRTEDLVGVAPGGAVGATVDGSLVDLGLVAVAPAPTARGPVVRALAREVGGSDVWGWLLVGGESVTSS
jgi:hypothetical protein